MSSIHKLLHVVDLVKDLDLTILAKRDDLLTTQFAFNLIACPDFYLGYSQAKVIN